MVQPDDSGNIAMYGPAPNQDNILDGKVAIPADAMVLVQAVSKATRTPLAANPPPPTTAAAKPL